MSSLCIYRDAFAATTPSRPKVLAVAYVVCTYTVHEHISYVRIRRKNIGRMYSYGVHTCVVCTCTVCTYMLCMHIVCSCLVDASIVNPQPPWYVHNSFAYQGACRCSASTYVVCTYAAYTYMLQRLLVWRMYLYGVKICCNACTSVVCTYSVYRNMLYAIFWCSCTNVHTIQILYVVVYAYIMPPPPPWYVHCVLLCKPALAPANPPYRGTSIIRNNASLGPWRRTMPMALWWSWGGWLFLTGEVTLYTPRRVCMPGCSCVTFLLLKTSPPPTTLGRGV